jgi:PQ loop repeat
MYYDHGWSIKKCVFAMIGVGALFGGVEAGIIFAIRVASLHGSETDSKIPINNGVDWPAKIFGVLGLLMIAGGLLPPYVDIYRVGRVRGFSFIFLMIDMAGALFSLLSLCTFERENDSDALVFQQFDILAAIIYIVLSL